MSMVLQTTESVNPLVVLEAASRNMSQAACGAIQRAPRCRGLTGSDLDGIVWCSEDRKPRYVACGTRMVLMGPLFASSSADNARLRCWLWQRRRRSNARQQAWMSGPS